MTLHYNGTKKALSFSAAKWAESLKFSKIQDIVYGSSKKNDLNMCQKAAYEYMIPAEYDLASVLSASSGTIPLVHKAGVLPNLNLTLRMFSEGIINVKWTW